MTTARPRSVVGKPPIKLIRLAQILHFVRSTGPQNNFGEHFADATLPMVTNLAKDLWKTWPVRGQNLTYLCLVG